MVKHIEGGLECHTFVTYPHLGYPLDFGTDYSAQGGWNFQQQKVSVDEGNFVPGTYRVNPYFVVDTECLENSFSYDRTGGDYFIYHIIATGEPFTYLAGRIFDLHVMPQDESLKQIALQKAMGNVNAALLGLGEELGELRETLQMLRHPGQNLKDFIDRVNWQKTRRDLFNFLRTGRFRKFYGKDAAKAAAATWMEYRYGFRPLFMTIDEIMGLVTAKAAAFDPTRILNAKGGCREVPIGTFRGKKDLCADTSYCDLYADYEMKISASAHASVQFRQVRELTNSQKLGLSWEHLPEIAWELTRLSFVVDWFYGIGPWLASMRFKPNVEILGNTVGYKQTREFKITECYVDNPLGTKSKDGISNFAGHFVERSYTRTIHQELAGPQFSLGRFMDYNKTIDLLAILFQNIKF